MTTKKVQRKTTSAKPRAVRSKKIINAKLANPKDSFFSRMAMKGRRVYEKYSRFLSKKIA